MARSKSPAVRRKSPALKKPPVKKSPAKKSSTRKKNPPVKHTEAFHYEFGGPPGALATMVALPLLIYAFIFLLKGDCEKGGFCITPSNFDQVFQHLPSPGDLFDAGAFVVVAVWFCFQTVLERCLPGEVALGVKLKDGSRLPYPLNGHLAFWVTLAVVLGAGLVPVSGGPLLDLTYLYDHYVHLATAALCVSLGLSFYLYATSFEAGAKLAEHGNSGNPVYDFFIGRELNPRIGTFDLKYFCELRPGLIGWVVLNIGCMAAEYKTKKYVSAAMLLVNAFQGLYVWDALFQERAILTTMDIINDGFGLAFGDLAWVPFTYSLQARYLVENNGAEGFALVVIFALNALGYAIFRGANGQKDAFRRDPDGEASKHLEWIPTKRGTKLLVSGWWGMARKINYTGDWLMGLSWCLCTGFGHPIPYFYATYFAILLIHRAMRDDEQCSRKYGDDWPKYKARVPYVFIPGVV